MRGNIFLKLIDCYIGILLVFILGMYCRISGRNNKAIPPAPSILLIKLSALGDTILMIPAIRSIREKFPGANISMIVTPINIKVVENCPYIDNIIEFKLSELLKNPKEFLKFMKDIRKRHFDIVIDADQWLRISALLSFITGAGTRIGFKTPNQLKHFTFTETVKHNRNCHEIECFYDLIRPLGITSINKNLEFRIDEKNKKEASGILKSMNVNDHDFIVIHPEVPEHAFQRSWPEKYYMELVDALIGKYNYKILLTGTSSSGELIKRIMSSIKNNNGNVYELAGYPFETFAAVLQKSKLLICCNTGVMHLACALKVPVVALHGPTDTVKWGPLGEKNQVVKSNLDCSPCLYLGFEYKCKTNKCMESIRVDEVLISANKIIS